jgi:flagellar biosynthesis/type III secretory pathway chaperone
MTNSQLEHQKLTALRTLMHERQAKILNDKKLLYKKMKFKFDKDCMVASGKWNARRHKIFKECQDMRVENQRMKEFVDENLKESNQKRNLMQRTEKEVALLRKHQAYAVKKLFNKKK